MPKETKIKLEKAREVFKANKTKVMVTKGDHRISLDWYVRSGGRTM